MTVRVDLYEIILRFPRLFPDPAIFEDSSHLANRYLVENGVDRDKMDLIFQSTDEIHAVDDRGNPSTTSGTAKFPFDGKLILAEFMSNANVPLSYTDFGTGLAHTDHSKLWKKGKLGELRFELRNFNHQAQTINLPDVLELYRVLKERATPTSLSTIELEGTSEQLFRSLFAYIKDKLTTAGKRDLLELEVYAARDLSPKEKSALERRLTRGSSKDTIFVILSRESTASQPLKSQ